MKPTHLARIARLEASAEEHRIQALRQTIAAMEQRKVELLADLTTLEAAIDAMQRHLASQHVRPQKERQP